MGLAVARHNFAPVKRLEVGDKNTAVGVSIFNAVTGNARLRIKVRSR